MRRIHSLRIVIVVLVLAALLSGCMDANEEFIQSIWRYQDAHLDEMTSESALIVIWGFSGGTFSYDACCFNIDEHLTGRYQIVESTEDKITIRLTNVQGSGTNYDGAEVIIRLDRVNDTLAIGRGGPFIRWGK